MKLNEVATSVTPKQIYELGLKGYTGQVMFDKVRKLVPANIVPYIMRCYDAEDSWHMEDITLALQGKKY